MTDKNTAYGGFILIVEDDPGTCELEAQRLKPLGLEIRRAETAEETIAILKAKTPELMLLDYSLPGANALELLKRIRDNSLTTPPFLIVTGRGDETVAVESMKSGASDYIIKNSDFLENLLPAAMKALDKAALLAELEAAHAALRDSEARQRALFENANVAIFIADARTAKILDVNNQAVALTGRTREELIGMDRALLHPREEAGYYDRQFREHVESGHASSDSVVLKKDGTRIQVQISATVLNIGGRTVIQGLFEDITERKRAEEALRESEEKYRLVVDNANEAITVVQDGLFRFVNPALVSIIGFSERELKVMPFPSIIHPGDRAMVMERYQKRLQGETASNRYTFRVITKAGNTVLVEINSVTITWDGRPAILCLLSDITERRKAEEILTEAVERKSRFASMVSHELRNPMTSITMAISLVLEAGDYLRGDHKELLEMVKENAERLGRLICDVLDFQKMAAGKMNFNIAENDIGELVRTTVKSMELQAKSRGLDLPVYMPENLPRTRLDRDKIIQVLTNLLGNAVAYTEKGAITVRVGHENNMLHISVQDTGIGIKAEDLPKLFQAFEQVGSRPGRKTGGTGLGLAVSKEIILAHNGAIWAESEPGKGSVFHFTLPAIMAEPGNNK